MAPDCREDCFEDRRPRLADDHQPRPSRTMIGLRGSLAGDPNTSINNSRKTSPECLGHDSACRPHRSSTQRNSCSQRSAAHARDRTPQCPAPTFPAPCCHPPSCRRSHRSHPPPPSPCRAPTPPRIMKPTSAKQPSNKRPDRINRWPSPSGLMSSVRFLPGDLPIPLSVLSPGNLATQNHPCQRCRRGQLIT